VTKDGLKIERMLYAGNNLDKARKLFAEANRASAADQADDKAADARAAAVANTVKPA
jgi:hypothetical protein